MIPRKLGRCSDNPVFFGRAKQAIREKQCTRYCLITCHRLSYPPLVGMMAGMVSRMCKSLAIACGGSPIPTSYPKRVHYTNFLWENRKNSCPSDRNIATCRWARPPNGTILGPSTKGIHIFGHELSRVEMAGQKIARNIPEQISNGISVD